MKVFLTLLILSHVLTIHAATKIILSTKLRGESVLVTKDENHLMYQTPDIKDQVKLEKCSHANYQFFVRKIERLSRQSIPVKTPRALTVQIMEKTKSIAPDSEFGKYLSNISQHLITLKKEMAIACKKTK
jgi:hypothetical protein